MSKNSLKAAGIAAAAVAGAGVALSAYSHARYHRSAPATLCEMALRPISEASTPQDKEQLDQEFNKLSITNEKPYTLPFRLRSMVFDETRDDMKTFHVGTTGKNEKAILYLHGGGYARQITPLHWWFVDRLCHRTGAEVCVPLYPLAPEHSYYEAYEHVLPLYEGMVERYGAENITLMGDSAGGGLAAGLALSLAEQNLPQPANLVLISPELDITLFNSQVMELAAKDPYLNPWALSQYGRSWADGDDPKSPKLSPLYGDLSCLHNVTLYTGTREIYYADIVDFADKAREAGAAVDLVVGQNLNHAWPLYPIPEAADALKAIGEVVKA